MFEPMTTLLMFCIFIIIVLVIVIALQYLLFVKMSKRYSNDHKELKKDNKDLLNRLLAKNTNDYKALHSVEYPESGKEKPPHKMTLEEQLIENGAMIPGRKAPYPKEL